MVGIRRERCPASATCRSDPAAITDQAQAKRRDAVRATPCVSEGSQRSADRNLGAQRCRCRAASAARVEWCKVIERSCVPLVGSDSQAVAASRGRRQEHASGAPFWARGAECLGWTGFEPVTPGSTVPCSTIELRNARSDAVRTRVAEHAAGTSMGRERAAGRRSDELFGADVVHRESSFFRVWQGRTAGSAMQPVPKPKRPRTAIGGEAFVTRAIVDRSARVRRPQVAKARRVDLVVQLVAHGGAGP